jgi:hypothetical protein
MRVVITTSTIPTREKHVVEMIESLRRGTFVPNDIYVNIPDWYPRFKKAPDPALTEKLVSMGVKVNSCKEYGVLTKLLPTLDVETDPETLLVVVDDDVIYQPRFLEGIVKAYDEFKCSVGYSGIAYPETALKACGQFKYFIFNGHGSEVEMFECAFGFAFPVWAIRDLPRPEPMNETSEKHVYLSDDYIYSRFLEMKGVSKKLVCYPWVGRKGDDWSTIWIQNSESQVHSLSRDENNLENFYKAGLKLGIVKQ